MTRKHKSKGNGPRTPNVNAQASLKSAPQSTLGSPFQTPPTSPSSSVTGLPSISLPDQTHGEPQNPAQAQEQGNAIDSVVVSVTDIASKDIVAIADLFSTMKTALVTMSSTFDRLGSQTEKMVSLSIDIRLQDQLQQLKTRLEEQIAQQKAEVEDLRRTLEHRIKEAVEEKIRSQLQEMIKDTIQHQIEEKVHQQLSIQIPEDLRQQVISHQRQILEVKTSLHNSEARRYNALQTVPNARLRPLLRPLPTPEQSPIIRISRSSSMGNSTLATPATAFPRGPAPTPIRRSRSGAAGLQVPETVPPTPSRFFPRDLSTLFALSQDDARRLLRDYGLSSATASPINENPKPRGLPSVDEESSSDNEKGSEDPEAHAQDMNVFMKHIGVPFLMIPAPKEKIDEKAPLSSKTRRKMLTPLIIK